MNEEEKEENTGEEKYNNRKKDNKPYERMLILELVIGYGCKDGYNPRLMVAGLLSLNELGTKKEAEDRENGRE